jgi:hypothetical protein
VRAGQHLDVRCGGRGHAAADEAGWSADEDAAISRSGAVAPEEAASTKAAS